MADFHLICIFSVKFSLSIVLVPQVILINAKMVIITKMKIQICTILFIVKMLDQQ